MSGSTCDANSTPPNVISGGGGGEYINVADAVANINTNTSNLKSWWHGNDLPLPVRYGDEVFINVAQFTDIVSGDTYGSSGGFSTKSGNVVLGTGSNENQNQNRANWQDSSSKNYVRVCIDSALGPLNLYRGRAVEYGAPVYLTATNYGPSRVCDDAGACCQDACSTSLLGWFNTSPGGPQSATDYEFGYVQSTDITKQVPLGNVIKCPTTDPAYNSVVVHKFWPASTTIPQLGVKAALQGSYDPAELMTYPDFNARRYMRYGDLTMLTSRVDPSGQIGECILGLDKGISSDFAMIDELGKTDTVAVMQINSPYSLGNVGYWQSTIPTFSDAVTTSGMAKTYPGLSDCMCVPLPDNPQAPTKWICDTDQPCTTQTITCLDTTGCYSETQANCVAQGCPDSCCGTISSGEVCVPNNGGTGCVIQSCIEDLKCVSTNDACCGGPCGTGLSCQLKSDGSGCECAPTPPTTPPQPDPTPSSGDTNWTTYLIFGVIALLAFLFLWF